MALQEVTPDHEPVAQRLNYIRSVLNIIAKMATDKNTYDEVLAEEVALFNVKNDVEWILSHLRETEAAKAKRPRSRTVWRVS